MNARYFLIVVDTKTWESQKLELPDTDRQSLVKEAREWRELGYEVHFVVEADTEGETLCFSV